MKTVRRMWEKGHDGDDWILWTTCIFVCVFCICWVSTVNKQCCNDCVGKLCVHFVGQASGICSSPVEQTSILLRARVRMDNEQTFLILFCAPCNIIFSSIKFKYEEVATFAFVEWNRPYFMPYERKRNQICTDDDDDDDVDKEWNYSVQWNISNEKELWKWLVNRSHHIARAYCNFCSCRRVFVCVFLLLVFFSSSFFLLFLLSVC